MSDRCYMHIMIRGSITSIDQMDRLYDALLYDFVNGKNEFNKAFTFALKIGDSPFFETYGVNYGNTDKLETFLQKEKIDYVIYQGEGDDYGAQYRSYMSSTDKKCVSNVIDGNSVIDTCVLEACLAKPDPLEELKTLVQDANQSRGIGLPEFTFSDEVKGWIAIGGIDNLTIKD